MSRGRWRRWSLVASGTALLCALPAVIAALPVPPSAISAPALRDRILASAAVPYEGYAESTVNLGLPELPDLHNVELAAGWHHGPVRLVPLPGVLAGRRRDRHGGERHLRRRRGDLPVELRDQPAHPGHRRGAGAAAAGRGPAAARAGPAAAGHRGPRGPDLTAAGPPDRRGGRGGPAAGPHRAGYHGRIGGDLGRPGQRAPRPGPDHRPRHGRAAGSGRAAQHVPGAEPDPAGPQRRHPASGAECGPHHHPAARRGRRAERRRRRGQRRRPVPAPARRAAPRGPPRQPAGGGDLRQRAFPLRAAAAAQAGGHGRAQLRDPGRGGQRRAARDRRGPGGNPGPAC